jgi:glutathione peroxidase
MKRQLLLLGFSSVLLLAAPAQKPTIYDFNMPDLTGKPAPFSQYKDKVMLIVNVASGSTMSSQLSQLQTLYDRYHAAGLEVLAFPSNDFGAEEPKSDDEMKLLYKETYHATFPVFSKISARGDEITPLFHYLTKEANPKLNGDVHWNYTKFIIDRKGKLVARFEPDTAPDDPDLLVAIENAMSGHDASSQEQQQNHPKEDAAKRRPRSEE